jgi:hypothetical protein
LQILEDTGKILVLPVLCTSIVVPVSRPAASYYPKFDQMTLTFDLENQKGFKFSYTSTADTGRFWKILVIPVLQILENSGKYW